MLRGRGGNYSGNERYEGFCIDLLKEIARMVGFAYRIELVPDGKYGVYDYETGEWNGIVRQLMDKVSETPSASCACNNIYSSCLLPVSVPQNALYLTHIYIYIYIYLCQARFSIFSPAPTHALHKPISAALRSFNVENI